MVPVVGGAGGGGGGGEFLTLAFLARVNLHSASKLKIPADLEPNLTTLLLSSKKPLKTVL
jgi:hypothetical protein